MRALCDICNERRYNSTEEKYEYKRNLQMWIYKTFESQELKSSVVPGIEVADRTFKFSTLYREGHEWRLPNNWIVMKNMVYRISSIQNYFVGTKEIDLICKITDDITTSEKISVIEGSRW